VLCGSSQFGVAKSFRAAARNWGSAEGDLGFRVAMTLAPSLPPCAAGDPLVPFRRLLALQDAGMEPRSD
jgi:hypothetical protein